VEKRERGGEWIKVNNYPTPNTSFTVQDLREGSRYEFRVIAVNEAGPGKPSKPTEPMTAEAQRCKLLSCRHFCNKVIQVPHKHVANWFQVLVMDESVYLSLNYIWLHLPSLSVYFCTVIFMLCFPLVCNDYQVCVVLEHRRRH
jgi:hypothetical protein